MHSYEWAALRVVPRVERGEFVNAGVVVYCQQVDFLRAAIAFDEARALAIDPQLDVAAVHRHLAAASALCDGSPEAGPSGARTPGERFRWLTAPRSTVLQPSPTHTGLTADPAAELRRLLDVMVAP